MAGKHRGSSAAELVLLKQLLQQGQAIKEFAFVIQQKRPMRLFCNIIILFSINTGTLSVGYLGRENSSC